MVQNESFYFLYFKYNLMLNFCTFTQITFWNQDFYLKWSIIRPQYL